MKNIIIVGDSFCMNPQGWPKMLADELRLTLISRGVGGEHWWGTRQFLKNLDPALIKNTEVIIFAHTFSQRLPTTDSTLGKFPLHNLDTSDEKQLAVKLYYKYIHNYEFDDWAQISWFKDISNIYKNIKMVHLHGFPWSLESRHHLNGINVLPNLAALSLNELGTTSLESLAVDRRINHFNMHNNRVLAAQLKNIIDNYSPGDVELDINQFESKTHSWFNWEY